MLKKNFYLSEKNPVRLAIMHDMPKQRWVAEQLPFPKISGGKISTAISHGEKEPPRANPSEVVVVKTRRSGVVALLSGIPAKEDDVAGDIDDE